MQTRVGVNIETIPRKDAILATLRFMSSRLRMEGMEKYILDGVEKNEWISAFIIRSYDENKIIHQELTVNIDWNSYSLNMVSGNSTLSVPANVGVVAHVGPSFLRTLDEFVVFGRDFENELWIRYRGNVIEEARSHFNTTIHNLKSVYAENLIQIDSGFKDLSEMSATRLYAPSGTSEFRVEATGRIVCLREHFGFVKRDGFESKKDYWFGRKNGKGNFKLKQKVAFVAFHERSGRLIAEKIEPVKDMEDRW